LLQSRIDAGRANTRVTATAAYACARAGKKDQARDILNELLALAATRRIPPLDLATAYIGLECWEDALDWLTKSCEERAATLYQFAVDPLYDALRSRPRAQMVRRSIGLPELLITH
jgi:hypothetical protein